MLQGCILPGIAAIPEAEWTACLPDEAEGWAYYAACEAAPPPGLQLATVMIEDEDGFVAGAPLFRLSYRLDTPFQGALGRLGAAVAARLPNLLEWRLLGVGSPLADRCHIALRQGLMPAEASAALSRLVAAVEIEAWRSRAALIAYKDLAPPEHTSLAPLLEAGRYSGIRSLPVARLDLPAGDLEAYLRTLSPATRKDVRRKLKGAGAVRIEYRTEIDDLASTIERLYESTRLNSKLHYGDFEELPQGYFLAVSRALGERARFVLYWVGEELAAFNLLLLEPDRIIDKFLGMAYPLAREHDLYVVSWIENVRLCLETGRRSLQSGQTAYGSKVRLGSRLVPSWNFVKHRSALVNGAIRLAAPAVAFDRFDPDLRRLRAAGRVS